jgi:hypothetical protein
MSVSHLFSPSTWIPASSEGVRPSSPSDEMVKALEHERKARKLESIPETVRAVLGEYFKDKELRP